MDFPEDDLEPMPIERVKNYQKKSLGVKRKTDFQRESNKAAKGIKSFLASLLFILCLSWFVNFFFEHLEAGSSLPSLLSSA